MGKGQQDTACTIDRPDLSRLAPDRIMRDRVMPHVPDAEPVFMGLIGSRAYGLEHAGSDWDWRGVYVHSPARYLSIRKVVENVKVKDMDVLAFDLRKIAGMAVKGNPNTLEILWSADHERSFVTDRAAPLITNRKLFLAREPLARAAVGFAETQLKHADRHPDPVRQRKFRLHALRVLEQTARCVRDGDMTLRVEDPERLQHQAAQHPGRVRQLCGQLKDRIDGTSSPLPDRPDVAAVDDLVAGIILNP